MFIHAFGPIKRGAEDQIKKVYFLIIPIVIVIFLIAFFVLKTQLFSALVISVMYFWGLAYCILGHKRLYKAKKYKGHKFFRWLALVIATLYFIYGVLLYFLEDVDFMNTFALVEVLALLITIQMVRNGYRY